MKPFEKILRKYFGLRGAYAIGGELGVANHWWTDETEKAYKKFVALVVDLEKIGVLEKGQADRICEITMDIA